MTRNDHYKEMRQFLKDLIDDFEYHYLWEGKIVEFPDQLLMYYYNYAKTILGTDEVTKNTNSK
jgi:hypothetical protein